MKNISRYSTLLILAVSLSAPLFASAITCPSGCYDGGDGNCYTNGSGVVCNATASSGSSGGSAINQQWTTYYRDLIVWAVNSVLVPILVAVSFIMLLYGAYKYFILKSAEEAERETGRTVMMYGIIGLVIIFSVWALVNIVKDTLVPSTAKPTAPAYPKL